ncbi:hypothetical protein B0H14DRAFT_2573273 [Mycena olivaceomarginata]|nr:hypothetical protein B0H14DRAFT_2573273 [Mycena olivaceomarginata]
MSVRNLGSSVRMGWGEVDWLGTDSDSWGRESTWLRSHGVLVISLSLPFAEKPGGFYEQQYITTFEQCPWVGIGCSVRMSWVEVDWLGADSWSREPWSTWLRSRREGIAAIECEGWARTERTRSRIGQQKCLNVTLANRTPRVELGSVLHLIRRKPSQGEGLRSGRHVRFLGRLVGWLYGIAGTNSKLAVPLVCTASDSRPWGLAQNKLNKAVQDRIGKVPLPGRKQAPERRNESWDQAAKASQGNQSDTESRTRVCPPSLQIAKAEGLRSVRHVRFTYSVLIISAAPLCSGGPLRWVEVGVEVEVWIGLELTLTNLMRG